MTIYPSILAYTYLIGWPELNKYYYGVRYAKGCNPAELWVTYFTSSKSVKEFTLYNGAPGLIEIRQLFTDSSVARLWEHRVLKKLQVINKEEWLNKTDNKSIAPLYGLDNPATRLEVRLKIAANTPRKFGDTNPMRNPDIARKVSNALTGRKNYWQAGNLNHTKRPEVRALLKEKSTGKNNGFYDKKHSLETKQHLSLVRTGIPKPTAECPHCKKIGGVNTMSRWHFNNCKNKE